MEFYPSVVYFTILSFNVLFYRHYYCLIVVAEVFTENIDAAAMDGVFFYFKTQLNGISFVEIQVVEFYVLSYQYVVFINSLLIHLDIFKNSKLCAVN